MPIGEPQPVTVFPAQVNVPMDHLFISVQIQSDGTPEGNGSLVPIAQNLIDFLQGWPDRIGNVTGQFYDTSLVPISPTFPDFVQPPDPE